MSTEGFSPNQSGDRSADFYAHSFGDETVPSERWQKLADHLRGVAKLARHFAEQACPGDANFARIVELGGRMYDLNNNSSESQEEFLRRQETVNRAS